MENTAPKIRVFPRRTKFTPRDDFAFIGDPELFRPPEMPVRISCAFTWDIDQAERLKRSWQRFYSDVEVGGPAYDDPGDQFEPGVFLKKGITITSRGCSKDCEWCLVWRRSGGVREFEIRPGWMIQDDNLLACSEGHIRKVFAMLKNQRKYAQFSGGLDAEIFNEWHADMIRSIKVKRMWFSCDYPGAVKNIEKVGEILRDFSPRKKRCYVMLGYGDESIHQAEKRLKHIYRLGFWPFAVLYRGLEARKTFYEPGWIRLMKYWSRPAIYRSQE
jgi:hypothetical protein